MSDLDDLLEAVDGENLTPEEQAQLKSLLQKTMGGRAIQRAEPVMDEFPAGPNAAMAIERRERAARLAREREEERLTEEQAIQRLGAAHARGIRMYGPETPSQAEARWREQEENDPEGVYGPGGASAGGIFGDGTIAMPDYDPGAHRRTEGRLGPMVQLRTLQVLERIAERLAPSQGNQPALQDPRGRKRLKGR